MSPEFKQMKTVNILLDGQTATFPGTAVTALPAGEGAAVVYYEPAPEGDDTEHDVTSFANGEDIPISARHLASFGENANVRHLYAL